MSRPVPFGAPLLLISLVLGLGACQPPTEAAEENAEAGVKKRETPPVRVTSVERREMTRLLETTSKLESEREIQVFPRSAGVAVEVLAEEGDQVEAGAVLARMDDRDEVLAVRDAEVALAEARNNRELARLAVNDAEERKKASANSARQAERDYERDRQLAESINVASPLSKQALEASQLARDTARTEEVQAEIAWNRTREEEKRSVTAIDRAQVALERAQLALEYRRILAPFGGVVAQRTLRVGDSVSTAEAAFVLTDIEDLRAVFARPQEELSLFSGVAPGADGHRLTLTATAEAHPGVTFEGYIERISPTIEADSGQFRVTARLRPHEDPRAVLLPGMLIRMAIVIERHTEALVVPKRALRREGDRRFVLAVVAEPSAEGTGRVRQVDVLEGFSDDEYVELLAVDRPPVDDPELGPAPALAAELPVVLVGSRDLVDGALVRIDDPNAPAPGVEEEAAPEVLADESEEDGASEAVAAEGE